MNTDSHRPGDVPEHQYRGRESSYTLTAESAGIQFRRQQSVPGHCRRGGVHSNHGRDAAEHDDSDGVSTAFTGHCQRCARQP